MTSVLFECDHLYYLPQVEPVMEEMRRRRTYCIAGSLSLRASAEERALFDKRCREMGVELVNAGSEEERVREVERRRFDVVIVGNVGHVRRFASTTRLAVMAYHGIGLKKSYFRDAAREIGLRAVESEERLRELESVGEKNGVVVGFPKLDPLARPPAPTTDPRDRRTILYAPTFYPSSLEKTLPFLTALSELGELRVKLHSFSWHHPRYRWQSALARRILPPSITLIPWEEYNIVPLYRKADVLVTDLSSTLFEFLAVNKPIVRTDYFTAKARHRLFPWRLARKLDRHRVDAVDFVEQVASPLELVAAVDQTLHNPHRFASERARASERFLYRVDGLASARLVDAIEGRLKGHAPAGH